MRAPDNDKKQAVADCFCSFDLIGAELGQVRQRIEELLRTPDEQIQKCLEYLTETPGKMIRPALVLLSGKCVGEIQSGHIGLAAMVELVHRASLLHDDVIDSGEVRRTKLTVNTLWGNTAAVLLGDFLLSRAFHLGTSIQVDGAAAVLSQTAQELCCGELKQNFCKGRWDISQKQYFQVIEEKTASLFKSSCCLGAMASNASREQIEAFRQFGLHLGIAFQMTDDLLDIIGTQKQVGKNVGTDLGQGKLTLPVIHWVQQNENEKQSRIAQLEQGCDRQALVAQMAESGSVDYAFSQVQQQILQAKQSLKGIPQCSAKDCLSAFADSIASRLK